MSSAFPTDLLRRVEEARIIAVLVIDEVNDAPVLADALLAGGIRAIELTLRTPTALHIRSSASH
jgi:2-dehydro-3-deoxyphosphogluconate aldolase/(4S)-4-hydroxy-2-oxoglutarate aldolase